MLSDHGPELIGRMIELARSPDPETAMPALRWCCDRLAGPIKARAEPVALPMAGDAAEQTKSVLAAVAAGRVTPEEGLTLLNALRAAAEVAEVPALKAELDELREKIR